jgi:hypothetical protein
MTSDQFQNRLFALIDKIKIADAHHLLEDHFSRNTIAAGGKSNFPCLAHDFPGAVASGHRPLILSRATPTLIRKSEKKAQRRRGAVFVSCSSLFRLF